MSKAVRPPWSSSATAIQFVPACSSADDTLAPYSQRLVKPSALADATIVPLMNNVKPLSTPRPQLKLLRSKPVRSTDLRTHRSLPSAPSAFHCVPALKWPAGSFPLQFWPPIGPQLLNGARPLFQLPASVPTCQPAAGAEKVYCQVSPGVMTVAACEAPATSASEAARRRS